MATDQTLNISIERCEWSEEAAAWLDRARGLATLQDLRLQQTSGAVLHVIKHQGQVVGAFLLRVDHTADGSEGVIVAGAAQLKGVDMMDLCVPVIESLFVGCKRIRYHTNRPAVARKMARQGYTAGEIVCIKKTRG